MSTEPLSDAPASEATVPEAAPAKRTTDQIPTNAREQIGERLFNYAVTNIPSHWVRQNWLRFFGMKIGKNTSIMMGTRVHGIQQLTVGNNCSIGFRCLLDARGELTIDDDVVLASDVHIVAGHHVVNSDDFGRFLSPIHIKHHVWVASRSTILAGVELGVGSVVGACSLVRKDVADMEIVAGVPAAHVGVRRSSLDYHPDFRPLLY